MTIRSLIAAGVAVGVLLAPVAAPAVSIPIPASGPAGLEVHEVGGKKAGNRKAGKKADARAKRKGGKAAGKARKGKGGERQAGNARKGGGKDARKDSGRKQAKAERKERKARKARLAERRNVVDRDQKAAVADWKREHRGDGRKVAHAPASRWDDPRRVHDRDERYVGDAFGMRDHRDDRHDWKRHGPYGHAYGWRRDRPDDPWREAERRRAAFLFYGSGSHRDWRHQDWGRRDWNYRSGTRVVRVVPSPGARFVRVDRAYGVPAFGWRPAPVASLYALGAGSRYGRGPGWSRPPAWGLSPWAYDAWRPAPYRIAYAGGGAGSLFGDLAGPLTLLLIAGALL